MLKCTDINFGQGAARDRTVGSLLRSPVLPTAGFEGPTSKANERDLGGKDTGQ